MFTPPVLSKVGGPLKTLSLDNASRRHQLDRAAAYDPETHTVSCAGG